MDSSPHSLIVDLNVQDPLVIPITFCVGRHREAVESNKKWGDDFGNRILLDYVDPLIKEPTFQQILTERLPELRRLIMAVKRREGLMKDFAYALTCAMADVEATLGDRRLARRLNRVTLRYLPQSSPHFSAEQLHTMREKSLAGLNKSKKCGGKLAEAR